MGKVWVKTRYDNDMQWDIPHSVNIATAMMGFRELGGYRGRRAAIFFRTINTRYNLRRIYRRARRF